MGHWDRQVIITTQNMIFHICKVMTIDWTETQNTKLHILQLLQILRISVSGMMMMSLPGWWIGEYEDSVGDRIGDDRRHENLLKWQYWNVWMSLPKFGSKLYVIMYETEAVRPRASGFPFRRNADMKWTNKLSQWMFHTLFSSMVSHLSRNLSEFIMSQHLRG